MQEHFEQDLGSHTKHASEALFVNRKQDSISVMIRI